MMVRIVFMVAPVPAISSIQSCAKQLQVVIEAAEQHLMVSVRCIQVQFPFGVVSTSALATSSPKNTPMTRYGHLLSHAASALLVMPASPPTLQCV